MNIHVYVLTQALLSSSSILSLSERHVKQCDATAAVGALMCWVQTTHGACALLRRPSADPGHRTIVAIAECKLWLVDRPEHDFPRMRQRRSEPASRVPPQLESAMLKAWERLLNAATPVCAETVCGIVN